MLHAMAENRISQKKVRESFLLFSLARAERSVGNYVTGCLGKSAKVMIQKLFTKYIKKRSP